MRCFVKSWSWFFIRQKDFDSKLQMGSAMMEKVANTIDWILNKKLFYLMQHIFQITKILIWVTQQKAQQKNWIIHIKYYRIKLLYRAAWHEIGREKNFHFRMNYETMKWNARMNSIWDDSGLVFYRCFFMSWYLF